jgi:hypothetical protein
MIVIGNNLVKDAEIVGDRVAIRNMAVATNLTHITVDGKSRRVVRISPSLYVPGVTIVTLEALA